MNQDTIVEFLDNLRILGHAVIVFTPEELQGADIEEVEESMTEFGFELIEIVKPESEDT
jgi:hypothetical protein